MASALFNRAMYPIVSSRSIRRRLTVLGVFCVLSLGLSNFSSSSSSLLKIGGVQSLSVVPFLRSEVGSQGRTKSVHSIRMEGSSSAVANIVVYVTVPDKETVKILPAGKKLAQSIVKEKLAACVNIVPGIESVYMWKGVIQTDHGEFLIIKTRQSLFEALTEHVKANHPYEVPEVIALPINGGSLQYLGWIKESTRD